MKYTFLIYKESNGYWAECVELQGCFTEGDTLRRAALNAKKALNCYLDSDCKWDTSFDYVKRLDGIMYILTLEGVV